MLNFARKNMRFTYLLSAFLILFAAACQQGSGKNSDVITAPSKTGILPVATDTTQFTTIQWLETTKDFGKINEGQKVEVAFRFKNTGDKPLVIYKVQPGCGCTVAETPEKPIAPGEEGVIKGAFDSKGRSGTQHKSLFVQANTKGTQSHELVFDLEVVKKS